MRWTHLAALLVITALAAGLRFSGLDARLPWRGEPDDVLVRQAIDLEARSKGAAVQLNFQYPLLLGAILHALPGDLVVSAPLDAPLEDHLFAAATPHRRGRILVALFSLLLVPATYALARALAARDDPRRGPALFAAAAVATSLLVQLYGQQARPHVPLAAATLLAVLACMRLARSGRLVDHAVAGLATAFAVAMLHNGAAAGLPLVVALAFRFREDRGAMRLAGLLPLAVVALAVRLAYPEPFETERYFGTNRPQNESWFFLSGHMVDIEGFNGSGFGLIARFLVGHEPVLCVLALVGLVLVASRARGLLFPAMAHRERWVALAFAVPYLLAIGAYARTFGRFTLPLVPYVACLAAVAFGALCVVVTQRMRRESARAWIAVGIALVLFALPLANAARVVRLRRAPDTQTLAARWIDEHIEASGRIFVSDFLALPLMEAQRWLMPIPRWSLPPWHLYLVALEPLDPRRPGPAAALRPQLVRPMALRSRLPGETPEQYRQEQSTAIARQLADPRVSHVLSRRAGPSAPTPDRLHVLAERIGPPIAVFSSKGPAEGWMDEDAFSLDDDGWLRLWRADRLGPRLEVRAVR